MNQEKAEQLTFLRFIAFLFIFFYHASQYTPKLSATGIPRFLSSCSVSFFFILSGLGKAYSNYNRSDVDYLSIKNIFANIKKKLKKIYPLYFTTTVVTIIWSYIPQSISSHDYMLLKKEMIQLVKTSC